MAYTDHNHVRTPREGDISNSINLKIDERHRIASRYWRRAVRSGDKRKIALAMLESAA